MFVLLKLGTSESLYIFMGRVVDDVSRARKGAQKSLRNTAADNVDIMFQAFCVYFKFCLVRSFKIMVPMLISQPRYNYRENRTKIRKFLLV